MRSLAIALAFLFLTVAAPTRLAAQQAPPASAQTMKSFISASDVAALIAKAKSERKDQPLISQPLLQFAPYNVNLEYRASVGNASVHEKEAEVFYVVDGAATMITGGKLVGENRTNAANLVGTAIEGGSSRTIAKGDFLVVPENTPHWFSSINGVLVLMSFHVPRP